MKHHDPYARYSHHYQPVDPQKQPVEHRRAPADSTMGALPPVDSRSVSAAQYRRTPQRAASRPKRRKKARRSPRSRNMLLAGSSMLTLTALIAGHKPGVDNTPVMGDTCQQIVQSESVLSRAELSQLLAVPERSMKTAIQQIIDVPYCTLNTIEVREGAIAEREAYPLEFDPQTWFVVLYEEDEYAGYDFSFRRE